MPMQKGSIIISDGNGSMSSISPSTNGYVLVSDNTDNCGLKWMYNIGSTGPTGPTGPTGSTGSMGPTGSMSFGNIIYVDKLGNDSTGQRNEKSYLTINAALNVAQSGDVVIINPGTYSESFTVPTGVVVRGISASNCIVSKTNVTSDTDLVNINSNCAVENLTLNISGTAAQMRTVVFLSTSNSRVFNCNITINNTGSEATSSDEVGVYCGATGAVSNNYNNLELVGITISTIGSGTKRGILLNNNASSLNCRNCNIVITGGTDSIGAETNIAGAILTLRSSYCEAPTADISRTLGTIYMSSTKLANSKANGYSFTTVDLFPNTIQYSLSGTVAASSTRYMRISDATSATEIKQLIYQKCLVKNLYVRARTGPGGSVSDVYTIRKNGVDTTLKATITGLATTTSNTSTSITFNAGDDLSMKLVTGSGSAESDIIVTVEIY